MLKLILFVVYIHNLEVEINSTFSKFVDDTKVGKKVLTVADWEIIQNDEPDYSLKSGKYPLTLGP